MHHVTLFWTIAKRTTSNYVVVHLCTFDKHNEISAHRRTGNPWKYFERLRSRPYSRESWQFANEARRFIVTGFSRREHNAAANYRSDNSSCMSMQTKNRSYDDIRGLRPLKTRTWERWHLPGTNHTWCKHDGKVVKSITSCEPVSILPFARELRMTMWKNWWKLEEINHASWNATTTYSDHDNLQLLCCTHMFFAESTMKDLHVGARTTHETLSMDKIDRTLADLGKPWQKSSKALSRKRKNH